MYPNTEWSKRKQTNINMSIHTDNETKQNKQTTFMDSNNENDMKNKTKQSVKQSAKTKQNIQLVMIVGF